MRYVEVLNEDHRGEFKFPDYPQSLITTLEKYKSHLKSLGYESSYGTTRIAFISPDKRIVIKLPLNHRGDTANYRERNAFTKIVLKKTPGIPVAACRTFEISKGSGLVGLMMQYVEPVKSLKNLPDWVAWVDCQQVGYNKKGDLVAYDL